MLKETERYRDKWRRQGDETGGDRTRAEGARFLGEFRCILLQEIFYLKGL